MAHGAGGAGEGWCVLSGVRVVLRARSAVRQFEVVGRDLKIVAVDYSIDFLLKIDLARSYILLAFPLRVFALAVSRWIWRQWLAAKRSHGECPARVLLVGSFDSVVAITRDLDRLRSAGYHGVGAVVPGHQVTYHLPGMRIPLSGALDTVRQTVMPSVPTL